MEEINTWQNKLPEPEGCFTKPLMGRGYGRGRGRGRNQPPKQASKFAQRPERVRPAVTEDVEGISNKSTEESATKVSRPAVTEESTTKASCSEVC